MNLDLGENGATYQVMVRAKNAVGYGAWSAPANVTPRPNGYWMLDRSGADVYAFGEVALVPSWHRLGETYVHIEPSIGGLGYWLVSAEGTVAAFQYPVAVGEDEIVSYGDIPRSFFLPFEQVVSLSRMNQTLSSCLSDFGGCVGRVVNESYWVFTSRGRVLPFGHAKFYGDLSHTALSGPVIASVSTASGKGYYMVASDGGVFGYGDAHFYGSMGGKHLNKPVIGLVPTSTGHGYWLVASDGGIFGFGDATFRGSMGSQHLNKPIFGMVRFGNGYLMVASDGGIFNFSSKHFYGALPPRIPPTPIVSVAASG
jgi:hypothetical protein